MLYTLTTTEQEVYEMISVFKYMQLAQIEEIFACNGKSHLSIKMAIEGLKRKKMAYGNESHIMLTKQTKAEDIAYTDCVWAIIEHVKTESLEEMMMILKNTFQAKAPALFCYTKGAIAYYVMKVNCDVDLNNLIVYQERLDAVGGKTATETAKIMVVTQDKEMFNKLPPLRYQTMKVIATHKSPLMNDKPEFEIIA